ncbi:hypothetical protein ACYQR9_17115 [Methylobacterium sp. CM6241]
MDVPQSIKGAIMGFQVEVEILFRNTLKIDDLLRFCRKSTDNVIWS